MGTDRDAELDAILSAHRNAIESQQHRDAENAAAMEVARARCEEMVKSLIRPVLEDFARRLRERGVKASISGQEAQ